MFYKKNTVLLTSHTLLLIFSYYNVKIYINVKFLATKVLHRLFRTIETNYLINVIKNTFYFAIHTMD